MIRFRKIFNFGRFRTSLSKSGMGFSWGIPGLRFGVSPNGRKYFSIGIPGTGLYMIKYFDVTPNTNYQKPINTNQKKSQPKKVEQWWKQKNLID
ncbi:MAG: DUF4236 domain-containing protein [Lactococcus chungangensis]|uniref:DUF4236 domain-containing protein n=1 Tax=Pseudolactococcus chungangensis TaxID=451457 RepID=A0A847IYT3_9LACT|nr:DUF4236 domain-containing protein [Lactococcus chungangensis]